MTASIHPLFPDAGTKPKAAYLEAFTEDWKSYKPAEGDPKKKAYAAWLKSMERAEHLSISPVILREIPGAYNAWLSEGSKKEFRPHKAMFSTFYNQNRWEGFMERATLIIEIRARFVTEKQAAAENHAGPDRHLWESLAHKIGDAAAFNVWFGEAVFRDDKIIVPSPVKARFIQQKYSSIIRATFGPDIEVVSG